MEFNTIIITWCTNFNGFTFAPEMDNITPEIESQFDQLNDNTDLPSISYDLIGEELLEAINEGDEEGEAIEDVVSDEDINVIKAKAKEEIDELFPSNHFEIKLVFNHTDT